ncbi:unnamed protein product, partial [Mesorhabditis spiculigera]
MKFLEKRRNRQFLQFSAASLLFAVVIYFFAASTTGQSAGVALKEWLKTFLVWLDQLVFFALVAATATFFYYKTVPVPAPRRFDTTLKKLAPGEKVYPVLQSTFHEPPPPFVEREPTETEYGYRMKFT